MEIVYIETSVASLLVANPSRDLATAAQQQATRDWWARRRNSFQCVTSDETLAESARGDAEQSRLRLAALAGMPILVITSEVEQLAAEFRHCPRQRARMLCIWRWRPRRTPIIY